MEKIPIAFDFKGKTYRATFEAVHGSGGNTWHIMINKYYRGRLRLNDNGWFVDGEFKEMADYFGQYVIAWTDGTDE